MLHVRDEEWVDVVRGTLPPARAAAIAAHLKEGCDRCVRAREVWLAVAQVAGQEHLYAPPDYAIRIARASFGGGRETAARVPTWATLIFDSLKEAGVGVRGFPMGPRHLLYKAGPLSIDLRLLESRTTTRHILIGQVADADRPAEGCGACQVEVLAGDRELDSTSANQMGEFELQFAPEPELALLVSVADRRPVHVPLGDVVTGR
jgi:hypothetical protein